MRPSPDPNSVSLSIMRIAYDGNRIDWPYQIEKYEDFANRPFEELWDYVSTPKYKLDRITKYTLATKSCIHIFLLYDALIE
jgi:hypothetical protein